MNMGSTTSLASEAAAGRAAPRSRLVCTNKGADDLAFHLPGHRINLNALTCQEGPRILEAVNPCGLERDTPTTCLGEFGHIIVLAQSPGDAAHPKLQALLGLGRHVAPNHHIRDGKAAARFEHAKRFL